VNLLQHPHPLAIVLFLSFGLFTAVVNYLTVRRLDRYPAAAKFPPVSVLVPARNEAGNIETCISSLLAQDYPDFSVLVLDDHSTDGTGAILARLNDLDGGRRLRVLPGTALPSGWLGKHWACHQLHQAADGELLLFTDADTRHAPDMLRASVSAMAAESADLLTAFPRQQVVSWGERLLVPFIGFGILTFIPVRLVQRLRWPALSVTIGQFMLFRRDAFEAVGGFAAVRDDVVDDMALGRRIIASGREWRLLDGTRHVSCRMYRGFWQAVDGFAKSLFAIFDYRILPYLLAWTIVGTAFLSPAVSLAMAALGHPFPIFPLEFVPVSVGLSLVLWLTAYRRFRFPAWLALLYPISMALFILIALRSMIHSMAGVASWKNRLLDRAAIRWM